jgi:hypothetical protein
MEGEGWQMSTLQQATAVLRAAEDRLRELIAQAAAHAEYDTLTVLAGWAKQVHGLWDGEGLAEESTPAPLHALGIRTAAQMTAPLLAEPPPPASRPARAVEQGAPGLRPAGRQRKKTSSPKSKARRAATAPKGQYPTFLREGDVLVKIGWSKSDRRTYEHRAPRHAIDLLVGALTQAGASGQWFTTEDLLPLRDPQERSDVPDYQSYLVLAWLRKENLIVQHGRQGYSLPPDADLSAACEQCWGQLPQR